MSALPVSLVVKSRDVTKEAVALTAASLATVTMMLALQTVWRVDISNIRKLLPLGIVSGVVFWACLRWVLSYRDSGRWRFGEVIQYCLLPALVIGFGNPALDRVMKTHWQIAGINAAGLVLVLLVAVAIYRTRSALVKNVARWLPVGVVVLLAFICTAKFSSLGATDEVTVGNPTDNRPNIVMIVLDTVRADHLKRYGYSRNTMPVLERWSDEALVFKRAISSAGWTAPAHATFFSGLTVSHHGVHYGSGTQVHYLNAFEGVRWLPELLAEEGYHCLAIISNPFATGFGMRGFDRTIVSDRREWYNATIAGLADHFSPLYRRISEPLRWRMPYLDAKQIVDISMRAVPEGGAPVFLFVNFLDAHSPYNPPPGALKRLGLDPGHLYGRYRSYREITRAWPSLPEERSQWLADLYDGEMRYMDEQLDRLLSWIDERFGENTIVVVTSDHGEELGEEGRVGHDYGLPQSILHVPMIVRGPSLPIGELDDVVGIGRLFDFLYLAGAGRNPGVDDFLRVDEFSLISERYPTRFSLVSDLGPEYGRPWVSLFEGGYKAIGPTENDFVMYDIESSGFSREIEDWNDAVADSLRLRIDSYWEQYRDRREETGEVEPTSEEMLKKLRALGYIQ
jgi:hypothetical protein